MMERVRAWFADHRREKLSNPLRDYQVQAAREEMQQALHRQQIETEGAQKQYLFDYSLERRLLRRQRGQR